MEDIHCVSDLNGCPDHSVVWDGLEEMEEIFTEDSKVTAEWLHLISRAGDYGNKGMDVPLPESNMQCTSHTCCQVKYLGFIHKEDQNIMFSLLLAERNQYMVNKVCASEISTSIPYKAISKIPFLFT